MRHRPVLMILFLLASLVLAGCAQGSAADVVEKYLEAKVASDADELVSLSCKDWEAQAELAANSFETVDAEIHDMSCKENGEDGNYTLVSCEGKIVVAYRGESREFNLNDSTYRAIEEDGEWKMCGEEEK
jgi:outer membrane lipoprotein-sorting protein